MRIAVLRIAPAILLLLFINSAYAENPGDARKKLDEMKVTYDADTFVRQRR